jgi:hypothetical protein
MSRTGTAASLAGGSAVSPRAGREAELTWHHHVVIQMPQLGEPAVLYAQQIDSPRARAGGR